MTIIYTAGRLFIGMIVFFCSANNFAEALNTSTQYEKERAVYQQALARLKQTDQFSAQDYVRVQQNLAQYPLNAYFQFAYIKKQFPQLPQQKIDTFLADNAGSYIAVKMHSHWLAYLARHKHWQLYRQYYTDSGNKSQQCTALLSDLALGKDRTEVFNQATQLWLSHKSMPDSCNPLFNRWQQAGYLSTALAWQRFQMAYAANQMKLAKYLVNKLNANDAQVANKLLQSNKYQQHWLEALATPLPKYALDSGTLKRLLRRLAGSDHEAVSQLIAMYSLPMNDKDMLEIKKLCAWYYAKNDANQAQKWLKDIQLDNNAELQEFELRYALQAKDWLNYKRVYLQTTQTTQQKPEWLYWYAIAQQQSGKKALDPQRHPEVILTPLAQQRHFYGFLAADQHSDQGYFISSIIAEPITDNSVQAPLAAAIELYQIGENREANRNWYFVSKSFDQKQWQQAAYLADSIQWYERSIQAHAKAKLWDRVDARFPLAFAEDFKKHSDIQDINASWLFAMARQESAFSPHARSHVGARGLLQLMPKTARRVAKSLNMRYNVNKLNEPSYNITLGSKYLKDMLGKFDNNYILATAAYNAGPHRVNEWLGLRPLTEDWVHWVATIPYEETRKYVQNILTYSIIYQSRLDKDSPIMLSDFAPKQASLIDAASNRG